MLSEFPLSSIFRATLSVRITLFLITGVIFLEFFTTANRTFSVFTLPNFKKEIWVTVENLSKVSVKVVEIYSVFLSLRHCFSLY